MVAGLLFAGSAMAQNNLTVTVSDNNSVAQGGVAVFFYDSPAAYGLNVAPTAIPKTFTNMTYTDWQGQASFFMGNIQPNDTVFWVAADCNGAVAWGAGTPSSLVFSGFNVSLSLACSPGICDALLRVDTVVGHLLVEAFSLRDSAYASLGGGNITHEFLLNWLPVTRTSFGSVNYDTLFIPLSSINATGVSVCYSRLDSGCNYICDSITLGQSGGGGNPNPLTCNAFFFPDSVNSVLFQGQIVLGEGSTTNRGSIVSYDWDFGDGTTISAQYPTHTYNTPTGVYNICLTITSVDGVDTCVSTYCDSIGFDANGNPVFKNSGAGFTVNVINPATFSIAEATAKHFSLYPNPAKGNATLSWDVSLDIESVEVYTLTGQKVRSLEAQGEQVELSNLSIGAYIVKVKTAKTSVALKLIVE